MKLSAEWNTSYQQQLFSTFCIHPNYNWSAFLKASKIYIACSKLSVYYKTHESETRFDILALIQYSWTSKKWS